MTLARVVAGEAMAYLRCGYFTTRRGEMHRPPTAGSRVSLGVLFVHGVHANATQFLALRRALEGDVRCFDAFEYDHRAPIAKTAAELDRYVRAHDRCDRLVAVGHSLGGLLLRIVLQADHPPDKIRGFVSLCAPLHGTDRVRLTASDSLRGLAPDAERFHALRSTSDRIDRLRGAVLTIGSRHDTFIKPASSALLPGHRSLLLEDTGHVGCLFDPTVHEAVRALVAGVRARSVA